MRLLHVTDVLTRPGSLCFVPQEALDRGVWVHAWTSALDDAEAIGGEALAAFLRQCDALASLSGEAGDRARAWWGYVESWRECKRATGAYSKRSEVPVGGTALGWQGKLDNVMALKGKDEVWDKKTGGPEPWHKRQLAAYEYGWRFLCYGKRADAKKPLTRRTVHLQADGSFDPARHLVEHTGRDDYRDYLACLRVAYMEINEGSREWPPLREGESE